MPRELTWSSQMNVSYTPADVLDGARYRLWWTASALVGGTAWAAAPAPWTLYASSDSTTAGIDTTDRWSLTGAYTPALIVRAAAGVHSWVVLQSPTLNGSTWYLTIDFLSAADYNAAFWLSKSAPTGGSTSARPTATDEWPCTMSGNVLQVTHTASAAFTQSIAMTTRGDFWTCYHRTGQAQPHGMFWVQAPADYQANDLFPIWSWFNYYATAGGPVGADALLGISAGSMPSRLWDGTTYTGVAICLPMFRESSHHIADPLRDAWNTFPAHTFRLFGPVPPTTYAYLGRLQDILVVGGFQYITPQTSYIQEAAVIKWASVGNLFMPADAALTL